MENPLEKINLNENEIIKWIPGYEEEYAATNKGKIFNLKERSHNLEVFSYLETRKNRLQYLFVSLNKKRLYTHKLIAQTYVPNLNNFKYVKHKNNILTDNDSNNLEWSSDHPNKTTTLELCQNLALSKKGKCLSDSVNNITDKLLWECQQGHQWFSKVFNIKQGNWCNQCYLESKRIYNLEFWQNLAFSRKGKCLSEKYLSINHLGFWECEQGHQWYAKFGSILYSNRWCKYCAGVAKKKFRSMFRIC